MISKFKELVHYNVGISGKWGPGFYPQPEEKPIDLETVVHSNVMSIVCTTLAAGDW